MMKKIARSFITKIKSATLLCCVGASIFSPAYIKPVFAYQNDAEIERYGSQCTRYISRSERRYGIPLRLLGAVANTETGRKHQGLGVKVPWPWSLNVEGKPYLFHTKEAAVAAIKSFQAQGKRSIDVGCMQVNLMHHPDAFVTVSQALEPSYNVDYAARFLRSNYDESGSWKRAVGNYHSRTPAYAEPYIAQVFNEWYTLANRLMQGGSAAPTQLASVNNSPRYNTFIRSETTGKEYQFTRRADKANDLAAQLRPEQVDSSAQPKRILADNSSQLSQNSSKKKKSRFDIQIIRPAQAAGKVIVSAPTDAVNADSGPLILTNKNQVRKASGTKFIRLGSREENSNSYDKRFIRFAN